MGFTSRCRRDVTYTAPKKGMSKMPEKEKKQLDVHAIVRAMYDLFV